MKILVVAASKHGSTAAVGEAITEELAALGHEVSCVDPAKVTTLEGVDVVVLGSAVYMSQWMETARDFVKEFGPRLRELPLWAFSVGLAGVPMGQTQDPRRLGEALIALNPIDHQTFKGRLDFSKLDLRERSVARLAKAPEGDYREWEKIRAWARGVGADLLQAS